MSISNIQKVLNLISTSQAIYAELTDVDDATLLETILLKSGKISGADFTKKEAQEFVQRYEIAAPFETKASGFQGIIFKDKIDNKYVFAIRGSEQIGKDFIYADGGDIGRFGFAAGQAADMYRYWKKLTTQEGQVVNYSQQEKIQLFLMTTASPSFWGSLVTGALLIAGIADTAEYAAFLAGFKSDVGLGAISASTKVDVTGHSLGGNLAYVFASMFPNNIGDVATINAPSINGGLGNVQGIGITGQDILKLLGFSTVDQSKITSLTAEGDAVHLVSGAQIGSIVNISQEVGHGVLDPLANNHSVINGLDSLNVMNLFAKLDPSQADKPSGILRDIMRASSNISDDTFENMLDALRYMMLGETIEKTKVSTKGDLDLRGKLYQNMQDLENATQFKDLIGKVTLVKTSTSPETAKSNYGQFLAVYYRSPFALNGTIVIEMVARKSEAIFYSFNFLIQIIFKIMIGFYWKKRVIYYF